MFNKSLFMKVLSTEISWFIRFTNGFVSGWHSSSSGASIFRNMAMLASGTGAAKVIGVASMPVITRIYMPDHFGVLAVFTSLTALLVPFGTLRYSMALPLPKRDGTAMNLAVFCAFSLLTVSLLATLVFWIAAPYLLGLLSMQELLPFWWLLPLALFGTGLYELLSHWAVRDKAFEPLARTKVWQAVIGAITKIGLGLLGLKPLGLLVGQVLTQAGGVLSLFKNFFGKFRSSWWQVSSTRIRFLIRRYADFPKYRLPSQSVMLFNIKAPLLFFAWNFGAETTGQFGLAMMVLLLPLTLFGQTTGQAYYAEIAKIGRKDSEKIQKITKNITKKLSLVSIPPFLILLFGGPWIFEIVFGEVWREAGIFASILAINLLTMFIATPITHALTVVGRQAYYLQINLVRLSLIAIVFYLTYALGFNPYLTLLFYSLAMSMHRIFVYWRIMHIIKKSVPLKS